jgi:hypothetical protein
MELTAYMAAEGNRDYIPVDMSPTVRMELTAHTASNFLRNPVDTPASAAESDYIPGMSIWRGKRPFDEPIRSPRRKLVTLEDTE